MKRNPALARTMKPFPQDYPGIINDEFSSILSLSLDAPRFVPPDEATFQRDDDPVLGLVYRGAARAYPFWIWDYHHVVNDEWMGSPIFVAG